MAGAHDVVLGLVDRAERGQAAVLADRAQRVAAAGEDLVRVGLVADVPEDLVRRGVEQRVQRDRDLAGAEVRPEVAADLPHGVDQQLTDLLGDLRELVLGEAVEVLRAVDAVEEGHELRKAMKSVICSSSWAPEVALARAARALRCDSAAMRARPVEPIARHVGQLPVALVRSLRLAEVGVRPCHVEHVVDDLEEHAQFSCERTEVGECRRWVAGTVQQQYAFDRRPDQAAGLELVQAAQASLAPVGDRAHVDVLPADHPVHARRVRELGHRREHVGRLAGLLVQREPERLRVEPVAREDGHVLAEADVTRRAAAAQVVVVHRRQVVVDQRVRVDQLERGRERQRPRGVAAQRPRRREREHRPDPLPAGHQRVAHRLLEPRGVGLAREPQRVEVGVDLGAQMLRVDGGRGRGHGRPQDPSASCPGAEPGPRRIRRAHAPVQLGARLGGQPCALVHERGGALRGQLGAAQVGRRALQPLDQVVQSRVRHGSRHSRAPRAASRPGRR